MIEKKLAIIYIAIFLVILVTPIVGFFTGVTSRNDNHEQRALGSLPKLDRSLSLINYPKAFDNFWNDNFGFRNWLVSIYQAIRINIFHITPVPDYDILGKSNWLFVNSIVNHDYKTFYSRIEFSNKDLELLKTKFLAERDFLKARNIEYMIVIVPDKEVIYPEYYPYPSYLITNIGLNQLINYLDKNTDLNIIYLKDVLLAAKQTMPLPLYYKTDTHWNNLGSFLGYQEIMRNLQEKYPEITLLKLTDFSINTDESKNDSDLIRVNKNLVSDYDTKIKLLLNDPYKKINKLHKIYVMGDSYSTNGQGDEVEGFNNYFKLSFDQVESGNYVWELHYDEVEKSKPELVIRESIQRNIYDWVDHNWIDLQRK